MWPEPSVYAAGDVSGKQGRKIAEHVMGRHTREHGTSITTRPPRPSTPSPRSPTSIVGRNAAELISVIALAVTGGTKVTDIVGSLLVHPSLAEALADAAE